MVVIQADLVNKHCKCNGDSGGITEARNKLLKSSAICLLFMVAEIIGSYFSGSLAITTDAIHLLTDFANFMISLFAIWISTKPAADNLLFGWYRAQVVGALLSVVIIWIVTICLIYFAILRLFNMNYAIKSDIMLITSTFGVLVNMVMAFILLHPSQKESHGMQNVKSKKFMNINVRSIFVHVIGDIILSVSVFIAALITYFQPAWKIADPICTFIFSFLVLFTTSALLKDIILILMEGVPRSIDAKNVLKSLQSVDGIISIHNLRIWGLNLENTLISAHIVKCSDVNHITLQKLATQKMQNEFQFFESTFQIEDEFHNCKPCNHIIH